MWAGGEGMFGVGNNIFYATARFKPEISLNYPVIPDNLDLE